MAASRLVERALEAASTPTEHSERGRHVPELRDKEVRELLLDSYRLIFHVGDEVVTILAFVHGARDFSTWTDGDGR